MTRPSTIPLTISAIRRMTRNQLIAAIKSEDRNAEIDGSEDELRGLAVSIFGALEITEYSEDDWAIFN